MGICVCKGCAKTDRRECPGTMESLGTLEFQCKIPYEPDVVKSMWGVFGVKFILDYEK